MEAEDETYITPKYGWRRHIPAMYRKIVPSSLARSLIFKLSPDTNIFQTPEDFEKDERLGPLTESIKSLEKKIYDSAESKEDYFRSFMIAYKKMQKEILGEKFYKPSRDEETLKKLQNLNLNADDDDIITPCYLNHEMLMNSV